MTASNFSEIVNEEASRLAGKTKKEPPVLSTEDQVIRHLDDRTKELRNREKRSEREKVDYTELNRIVGAGIAQLVVLGLAATVSRVRYSSGDIFR